MKVIPAKCSSKQNELRKIEMKMLMKEAIFDLIKKGSCQSGTVTELVLWAMGHSILATLRKRHTLLHVSTNQDCLRYLFHFSLRTLIGFYSSHHPKRILKKSRGKTKKFDRISDEAVQKTHKLKGAFHQGVVLVDSFCRIKDLRGESNSLKLAARLALE